jgi:hypothetical protein
LRKQPGKEIESRDFTYRNTLTGLQRQIQNAHNRAKITANRQKRQIQEGDVLANLEFGFWVTLCGRHYANDLHNKRMFESVFRDFQFSSQVKVKDRDIEKTQLREHMHKLRDARNRVFHHEFVDVRKTELLLEKALRWICQESYQRISEIVTKEKSW